MRIIPVPVREDNYAYIVMSTPKGARPQGAFVDPYDVPTVRRARGVPAELSALMRYMPGERVRPRDGTEPCT